MSIENIKFVLGKTLSVIVAGFVVYYLGVFGWIMILAYIIQPKLEKVVKPDGYNDDGGEWYADPYDYVEGQLDEYSKVGDEYTLSPYVKLPDRVYRISELKESGSFELEEITND